MTNNSVEMRKELAKEELSEQNIKLTSHVEAYVDVVDVTKNKTATFIGGALDELLRFDIAEAKFKKLLAPNKPEYYEVNSRNIVGVDDCLELVIDFVTDLQVTVQYGDMMLNDVKKISIMPNVNDEGSYITLYDSNELQLALIIPENEMHTLYIKDVSVEEDMMLFVDLDILYHIAPDMEYPYIWLDHEFKDDTEEYSVKGKLNPTMIIPRTLVKSLYNAELGITDLAKITSSLKGSKELAFLPYTGILVDDNYECYEVSNINDLYIDTKLINSNENIGIPYIEFMNLKKDYQFKHYIGKDAFVIKINKCESDIDMQIINNRFDDDNKNIAIIEAMCDHYDELTCDNIDVPALESVLKSLYKTMNDIKCNGMVVIDSPNEQLMIIEANEPRIIKLV